MQDKLFILIGTLQSGGAERVVSEISAMYADYFKKVTILTYYNAPVFYKIDERVKLLCIENASGTKSKIKNGLWLREFVKKERPDVFLSFLMPFNIFAIVSFAFIHIKIVVCERQDPGDVKTPLLRVVRNFLYHYCSRIEVQTLKGKKYFSEKIQRRITVIPNPNHITETERDASLNSQKENRVAVVGRLIPLKNHKMLINVFAKAHVKHPEYTLDIYGDGEMRDAISQQIQDMGLCDAIFLRGRTSNISSALATARIFVLCSNVEGMPNALMEAVALGIPSIATDVSGVREIIDDGKNGFVIPVGDENALEKRLVQLMDSEDLQKTFSEASSFILDKFDKERIFRQWLDLVTF